MKYTELPVMKHEWSIGCFNYMNLMAAMEKLRNPVSPMGAQNKE
jgi:hypothetical protein